MISGKGGVGKTTLSCSLARQLARQHPQETVMLLSTDPAHSLGDVLNVAVDNTPTPMEDLPNLQVRALDARELLNQFRQDYGDLLELLIGRGSFVEGDDLTPVWDMGWPGLDELMALLEIQRILRQQEAQRVMVDMAPSGHTLSLFALMDFLDTLLNSLDQFQEKHRYMTQTLSGHYTPDEADRFIQDMQHDLDRGRALIQDPDRTACWVVGIPEPMSLLESQRFIAALADLSIPVGGLIINRVQLQDGRIAVSQQSVLPSFRHLVPDRPLYCLPLQATEPVGAQALDQIVEWIKPLDQLQNSTAAATPAQWPEPVPPRMADFIAAGRRLVIVGGKGGVGKTTVSAAVGWAMAQGHPEANIRVMSIDPAHSLGDAFGQPLGHEPTPLLPNLQGQEVNADIVLDDFRRDYLWELADMMSGDSNPMEGIQVVYGPEAWRQIVAQALPGIDEMLSLVTVMDLLEQDPQRLIVAGYGPHRPLAQVFSHAHRPGRLARLDFQNCGLNIRMSLAMFDFMGRLRTLRKRVMAAQAKLRDPAHTEFIGVVQNQSAILAEAQRLTQTLATMGIHQQIYRPQPLYPRAPLTRRPVSSTGPSCVLPETTDEYHAV